MFTPYEICVGLRYTRAKRRNHFISFISLTSMIGIGLGATALITVISVMNGFERELRERILGVASHATISAYDGSLEGWEPLARAAADHPEVIGSAPFVESQAMLTRSARVRGALVRGVLPEREPQVSELGDYLVEGEFGSLVPGRFNILLGSSLARRLDASVGMAITLVAPQARVTAAGILPRMRRFTVSGIFRAGHSQYDTSLAVIHIDDARRMFRLGDGVSGVRIKLADMFDAPRVSRELGQSLGETYWLRDWTQYHANFFRALKIEKTVMFVILTLIVAVAAFNLVSTPDHGRDRQGVGHRDSAHARSEPAEHPVDIRRAGHRDRIRRHPRRRSRRRRAGHPRRDPRTRDRELLRREVPLPAGLLHQRGTVGDALERRHESRSRGLRAVGAGDPLPRMESLSSPAGGGAPS